jgi:rod shape-determining protein MreB
LKPATNSELPCYLPVEDILNIKNRVSFLRSDNLEIQMGLFSFLTQEIAIDLGTANTIIIYNDKIVVDEPSIVAIDLKTEKMVAIGEKARQMQGKTHANLKTIRPLRDGVIADFNAAEQMIRGMIKMINPKPRLFSPALKMVICIPSGSTEVEIRAVRDSSEHAGGREVYMIYEPMAAAIGIGLDVEAPEGNMVVDIGGGTTEIAVISLGGIVTNKSIRIAGDDLTADIMEYMRHQHNIKIGERTAEEIKIHVGSALSQLQDPPPDYVVQGPNQMTALPIEVPVSYQEIAHCLEKSISKIETAILSALEQTPPELYADIVVKGIWLAGGGALLKGLDKRLTDKIGITFHIAEDPLRAVVRGTGIALKNVDNFSFLIK